MPCQKHARFITFRATLASPAVHHPINAQPQVDEENATLTGLAFLSTRASVQACATAWPWPPGFARAACCCRVSLARNAEPPPSAHPWPRHSRCSVFTSTTQICTHRKSKGNPPDGLTRTRERDGLLPSRCVPAFMFLPATQQHVFIKYKFYNKSLNLKLLRIKRM